MRNSKLVTMEKVCEKGGEGREGKEMGREREREREREKERECEKEILDSNLDIQTIPDEISDIVGQNALSICVLSEF